MEGSTEPKQILLGEATTINLSNYTPTRDGYTFVGWFTDKTGGAQATGEYSVESGRLTTLYAHWEQAPSITSQPQSATYDKGSTIVKALSVTATGEPNPTYQWYKNSTNETIVDETHIIADATSQTYMPDITQAGITYYYYVSSI